MSELDLRPLVDWAIVLDQEDRELRRHQALVEVLESDVASATPASLERRLRDLATVSAAMQPIRWTTPALFTRLTERIERQQDHPEVMALMGDLLGQAHRMMPSMTRLRRRIRDLEMVLVGAVKDQREQSLDSRMLRLASEECTGLTVAEIHGKVEKDHEAIADAMATWRLSTGSAIVFSVRDGSTREEIEQALRRLERTGHAVRRGRPFGLARWVVRRQLPEIRLSA